jgi:predicted ester cyclase
MTDIPAVLQSYIKGLMTRDVQRVASTVSENLAFVSSNRTLNKSEFVAMLQALYTAFPDWHYQQSPPEIQADVIAIQWRQSGTHLGTFAMPGIEPIEATGRTVTIVEQYFTTNCRTT